MYSGKLLPRENKYMYQMVQLMTVDETGQEQMLPDKLSLTALFTPLLWPWKAWPTRG